MIKTRVIPDIKVCETCLAYWRDRKCDAYPKGIPARFWTEKEVHFNTEQDQILDFIYFPMPDGVY